MNKKEQEQIKEVLTLTYPVKLSYNSKAGLVIAFQNESHAYSILNYNRKRKNPVPFDQWVRIIVDNQKKRVWIRVTDEDPEISFNLLLLFFIHFTHLFNLINELSKMLNFQLC